jgi:hypothetical protein
MAGPKNKSVKQDPCCNSLVDDLQNQDGEVGYLVDLPRDTDP